MNKQLTHENILEKWEHLSHREKIICKDDYGTALMLNTLNKTDMEELKEKYKDILYTPDLAGSGQFGICVKCGLPLTPEGHDGCLGINHFKRRVMGEGGRVKKVGDILSSRNYGDFEIVEYINYKKIKIRFLKTGYTTFSDSSCIGRGKIKDPLLPSVYGVGYLGAGEFKPSQRQYYTIWISMLERVYGNRRIHNCYKIKQTVVCEDWLNYQNFCNWCKNEPNFSRKGFDLDKDLKVRFSGKSIYSPETCSFIPQELNKLVIRELEDDRELPIGVYKGSENSYSARCWLDKKVVLLGSFSTPREAFKKYKHFKENIIRTKAEEYYKKGCIVKEVYENLMRWEIEPFT